MPSLALKTGAFYPASGFDSTVQYFNFISCPIESLTEEGEGFSIRQLFHIPIFWIALILMVCAGASEISMAQWASAYVESALGISKNIGDIIGPCLFAIMMGISRFFYGNMVKNLI